MAIKNNLRIVMAEKKIDNLTDLMRITGLSRNAVNKLWHDKDVTTVKIETLVQICDSLKIKLSDLIEYIPDKEETSTDAAKSQSYSYLE